MGNVGEEMVGAYLQAIRGCGFVQYNVPTGKGQGEIDVLGLDFKNRAVYVCEVAVHLTTGLMYVDPKTKQPCNVERLTAKFAKDLEYADAQFPEFEHVLMFWSPVVKSAGPKAKHNQVLDVEQVCEAVRRLHGVEVEVVINHRFRECLKQLKKYAGSKTVELKSPVLRLLQIEALLEKHLGS